MKPLLPIETITKEIKYFFDDLSEKYQNELLSIIEDKNPKNKTEINLILREFRKNHSFKAVGKFTSLYWEQRGWTKKESLAKRKEKKCGDSGSPMQIKFWVNKINKKTGNLYTEEEAKYKIKSQRKFNKEYWIERGKSENNSIEFAKKEQLENAKKATDKAKKDPNFYKNRTWNQIKYWVDKEGITEDAAIKKISDLQRKNDINILMKKHGDIEGRKIYDNICKKLAYSHSIDGYIERYGEKIGNIKYAEDIFKKTINIGHTSRESILFFIPLYKELRKYMGRDDIKWGIQGSKEFFIWDNTQKRIFFMTLLY